MRGSGGFVRKGGKGLAWRGIGVGRSWWGSGRERGDGKWKWRWMRREKGSVERKGWQCGDPTAAATGRLHAIKARGGGGLGGGHGGGTWWCGGGGGGWSPSLIFLEQPLERESAPFFLQMTTRVCGGVPSPLIEPKMGQERKGPT